MMDPSIIRPAAKPEPAWVRFWRANPGGKTVEHTETKGQRKRTRAQRKAARS